MRAIELFAGIGGFRVAADRRSIRTVWANDICPKASRIYRARFGEAEHVEGDIRELIDEIPKHDLLTGGFPCQPFSSAGKKAGIRDPRGTLFQSIIDVLVKQSPDYFILENVKRLLTMERGMHFATILASLSQLNYLIEWRLLNAMDFSLPQNRQRVLILGVKRGSKGPLGNFRIRLATKDDLSDLSDRDAACLAASDVWTPIGRHKERFSSWGVAWDGRCFGAEPSGFSESRGTMQLRDVLEDDVADHFDFTEITNERLRNSSDVNRFVGGVQILSNQGGGARMGYTIFGTEGVAPTLTSATSRHYERYKIGSRYRRLTNVEYARIQGFADDHCREASIYDQYALYGNAVPPPMAGWVMDRLKLPGMRAADLERATSRRNLFAHVR